MSRGIRTQTLDPVNAAVSGPPSTWRHPLLESTDAPTTSNQDGGRLPFQRWFRFKEAFAPALVADVVRSSPIPVRTCLDPFGGSGTTALTSQFLGIRPTTIEVNPFLADVAEAKLCAYDGDALTASRLALARLVGELRWDELEREIHFRGAAATFVEPGVKDRWIFDRAVAARILTYRAAIGQIADPSHGRLFRVLLGSTLLAISNVVVNGKGRRYRGGWGLRKVDPEELDRLFDEAFKRALYDVWRFRRRACGEYALLRGDARTAILESEAADLVLFSPPYPNSFDYTDIYNVELWALGYLDSPDANRMLREATLRSHVQIKRDFAVKELESDSLRQTLESLSAVRGELWNRHIPDMVGAYFADLRTIMAGAAARLTPGGQVVMVVGDSRYADITVDVSRIIGEIAPSVGLEVSDSTPVRSMRSSAQQGGDFELGEWRIRLVAS
jgi:hypothetical protein